ncbi:carboxy-S-adenosyl-L-methionine synthase CmoA [Campylobacter sp. MIT 21-1685]|uniref:carboxy-S-adenosyl-L-methionine synthase CmoA n=1 Tax=unclassified Campylobacter TaxID=2593542 RepID=UPI00224B1A5D|nr:MULTISPECIES: carboxy-S-adenosyl-L-methionine synthase CmoA [unclassified Campylobacter]MCX2682353.1 carboxy-S-adenosyl-L-methionine synthase CmoA [Campylobacter sp. MIT 21-1684]MCX2750633.1 carboxy-S-adenosyl-L-methionine synthase CmoA [Campylobacter sp. MIT 21-1682]MCX2806819.1 carboxy-S-adenosyl-L-methionine synthase CmoA [Campylobacter sp. MIT 21-1685]
MKDELFKQAQNKQFEFDENVANVFDDMVVRSVPYYKESLAICADLLSKLVVKNAKICDLGCASANFLLYLANLRKDFEFYGIDNSHSMLELAQTKSKACGLKITFFEQALENFNFFSCDVFVANYTLQFVRPLQRQSVVDKIYDNLNKDGIFLLSEKILYEDPLLAKNMIEIYTEYKQKQGYSSLEIARKREALENVLIPYSEKENIALLQKAGFRKIESIFKWANFESFIAFK